MPYGDQQRHRLLHHEGKAHAGQGYLSFQIAAVDDQRAVYRNLEPPALLPELPVVGCCASGSSPSDAAVGMRVIWVEGRAPVAGRCCGDSMRDRW